MQIFPFPHRFDRYRLISLIFRCLRAHTPNFKQGEIEALTGIDQTTISRLLGSNAMRRKAKFDRDLNRGHLLVLSRKGFRLGHKDASLILWLAEARTFVPWRASEFQRFGIRPPDPRDGRELDEIRSVNAFRDDAEKAHSGAVNLLREVFVSSPPEDGWHKIRTNILHGNSAGDTLALHKKLRDMEYRGGQRMIVSQYPSILVTSDLQNESKLLKETPEPVRTQLLEMLKERKKTFDFNVDRFGERAIHSITSLRRFVHPDFKHPLPLDVRRQRIRGLARYLEKYQFFQVGLIPETGNGIEPEIEIAIKSTREAVIRGTSRDLSNHPQTTVCGPSFLHWDSEWPVVTFYLDFEKEWEKLNSIGTTNRRQVLGILNDILR